MSTAHDIQLALRTAAGHERAALAAEAQALKTYEMKMVSAGASAYEAFVLALKAAPDFQGRKIDDKAIRRIYTSTKPRPWWDAHLAKVKTHDGKPATRDWGKRLIQWHLDPEAAKARRAAHASRLAAGRKVLKEKADRVARGARAPQVAPTRREVERVVAAGTAIAHAGRADLPRLELAAVSATRQDCMGELNRIRSALDKLREGAQFDAAIDLLKAAARELERL